MTSTPDREHVHPLDADPTGPDTGYPDRPEAERPSQAGTGRSEDADGGRLRHEGPDRTEAERTGTERTARVDAEPASPEDVATAYPDDMPTAVPGTLATPGVPDVSATGRARWKGKGTRRPSAEVVRPTRISGTWIAIIVAIVVLIFLLVFILQNLTNVTVTFLGLDGTLPLGVAMLFAAIAGALLVALVGAARILQLRRRVRRFGDTPASPPG